MKPQRAKAANAQFDAHRRRNHRTLCRAALTLENDASHNYAVQSTTSGGGDATLVPMPSTGLRERKKARTRRLIADTAARLFAQHGYENVAVSDVAREAEVAEQTVFNYFPTKERLVTDRDEQVQDRLTELIRSRAPGVTAAGAIREFVLESVAGIRAIPPAQWRGELGYLAAISTTVHRLALEMIDRQAAALAVVIGETGNVRPEIARLQGIALAGVFEIIISEAGRRTRAGQSQAKIAKELHLVAANVLDELDRWFKASGRQVRRGQGAK
jgi:AcrR family transcriptional regulator